jgi:hypothetical protein
MTQNANARLNGPQVQMLAHGLLSAFVDFNDLATVVRVALDKRLNEIVDQQAGFETQVWKLVEWADAKGQVQQLFRAAIEAVPENRQLRQAVEAVLGDSPAEQLRVRADVEAVVVETHEDVLVLKEQMQQLLARLPDGPVRPQDSFSIREEERPAVKALLARFRQLPAEENGPSTACPCWPTPWRRPAARTPGFWPTAGGRGLM